jgi:hypothetical protein
MISNAVIDALVTAGATAEMIAAAVKADSAEQERENQRRQAEKRTNDARRQRKKRERERIVTPCHAESTGQGVTVRDALPAPSTPAKIPEMALELFVPAGAAGSINPRAGDLVASVEDPKSALWREGRTILISLGISERQAGGLLGKWLRDVGDAAALLDALRRAEGCVIVGNPVAYLTNLINERTTNGTSKHRALGQNIGDVAQEMADQLRASGN